MNQAYNQLNIIVRAIYKAKCSYICILRSIIESIAVYFAQAYKKGGSLFVQTYHILHVVTCIISNVLNSSTTQNIYCRQYQLAPDRLLMRKSCRPKDWPFLFSSNK